METFQNKLEALTKEITNSLQEFLSTKPGVTELFLTNQPASTEDSRITILGVLKTNTTIALIGESDDSREPFYAPIETCNINDLAFVMDELTKNAYHEPEPTV